MFRIVGNEIWLDGWLVARLNVNLPASLRQITEDWLTGVKMKELEAQVESLESQLDYAAWDYERFQRKVG